MQKVKVTTHNVHRVFKRLLEIYVPLRRGQEEGYNKYFFVFDSNMLKLRRKNPSLNSRRAREAVDICLVTISGYLNGIEYDFSEMGNEENFALARALQMAYDPFVNPEIAAMVSQDLNDMDYLKKFFEIPFKCLHRLQNSIDFWIQSGGSDGYFSMVEGDFGPHVPNDDEMNYIFALVK